MSKVIDNYLAQKAAKERRLRQKEVHSKTSLLLEFADKMDNGEIVHYSNVSEKFMLTDFTTDISGFHDIALSRKTHYIYDKRNDLLALADESDLRMNRFYKIIAKIQTCMNYAVAISTIALICAIFSGMIYDTGNIIKLSLIILAAFIITHFLFFLKSEYHNEYELYGVVDKTNHSNYNEQLL